MALVTTSWADLTGKPGEKKAKNAPDISTLAEVNPTSAKFVATQSVDIELVASVPSLRQVTFMIREAPKHGTLSAIRPHPKDNNKAIVTYTHRDAADLTDQFTFACRAGEGPVSAAAIVTLTGVRMEAKLKVDGAPRMDKVYLGGESSARLRVKNEGKVDFIGLITWPAPWSGPPQLALKVGEEQDILIRFKPTTIGAFRLEQELQLGVESSRVMAYGECARSLTISPGSLVLAFDKKSGTRQGSLSFANARPEAIKVSATLPDRLKGITEFELEPKSRKDIVYYLAPEDVKEFRGDLELLAEGEKYRIAVAAGPKAGDLTVLTPAAGEVVDFGKFEMGGDVVRKVSLKNTGGLSLTLSATTSPPFFLETQGRAFRIEPGQSRDLAITLKADRFGEITGEMLIEGGDERAVLKLAANVIDGSAPAPMEKSAASSSAPRSNALPKPQSPPPAAANAQGPGINGRSQMASALAAYLAVNGIPIPKDQLNPYLERVERVDMTARTSTSIDLAWPKPKVPPVGWRLDVGSYVRDPATGITVKYWTPFENWKLLSGKPDWISVQLQKLTPSSQMELRIMAVDRDGKFSEPSPICLVSTNPAWQVPTWVWRMLIVAALSVALYYLYRYKRGDFTF
jgi:hypothetical protein